MQQKIGRREFLELVARSGGYAALAPIVPLGDIDAMSESSGGEEITPEEHNELIKRAIEKHS